MDKDPTTGPNGHTIPKAATPSPIKRVGLSRKGISTMRAMQRIKSVRKGSTPVAIPKRSFPDELTQVENGAPRPLGRALSSRLSRKNMSDNLGKAMPGLGALLKGRGAEEVFQAVGLQELQSHVQRKVASSAEVVVLVFKVMRGTGDARPQVLAVSRSDTNLFVYRLGFRADKTKASGFDLKPSSRFSLKCLVLVDGRGAAAEQESCLMELTFRDDKRGELRKYTYAALKLQDKMAVLWCLIQLCLQYLHFLPQTQNLIRAELGLYATQHNFEALCPLLSAQPNAAAEDREVNGDGDGGGRDQVVGMAEPVANLTTLTAEEETELHDLLKAEGMNELNSGDLLSTLQGRIQEMEAETAEEMRSWERRGDEEGLNDPVEDLVLKLEGVEMELSQLDGWMSNYNEELKTMRKGIQKIEQENNRLQIKSRNQRRLKQTLASMLQRYNVDRDTQNVLDNVANILFVECLGQVEDANPAPAPIPQHEETALKRILQAAEKLSQASQGQAVPDPGLDPAELPRMEREESLRAIRERIQQINDACERFVYNINCFMLERFKTIASQAAHVQPSDPETGFPTLEGAAKLAHRKLLPYRVLVRTTLILKHTLSEDYYDMMLAAYRTEISGLYRGVFKGFFQQLAQATAKGNNFDSRLSSMPPAAIGDHEQEKQRAMDLVRKAASDSRDKHTSSFALRYCLKQISKVILAEQAFIARMFFAGDGSNSGNATDRGLNDMQQSMCDSVLRVIFLEQCHSLELLDEYIVQPVRGGINNYEMMSMVVQVDAAVVRLQGSSTFLVNMLTDSTKGLQGALQASFVGFVEEQQKWIDGLRPDIRYAGILEPFLKFPPFIDTILAVWELCYAGNENQAKNPVHEELARNSVRISLQQIASTLFAWLERVALSKPKYTLIVKIENFYFFQRTMQKRGVQELGKWERLAGVRFEGALSDYVSRACETQFTDLVKFVDSVDLLLDSLKASDIVYHKPKDELGLVLKKLSNVKPGIAEMRARVSKHFCNASTVRPIVAERIVATTLALFEHFEHIVKSCYAAQLQPSANQVSAWLQAEFNPIIGRSGSATS